MTEDGFGFGLEYVLLQRGALGCKVDGCQHKMGSYTHADAEVIAATVAGMPDSLGGIRMAIRVAELVRARLTPDWMPGVMPHCVSVEVVNAISMASAPPRWWSALNACCIAGAGAAWTCWPARWPGGLIRSKSLPPARL